MAKGLVSIVIPIYNVERYLRECLDSVLAQTYTDIEVILVDDGSKDSSPAICDEYAKKDDRIQVIHKQNGGLPAARWSGVLASTGDSVYFVDSDDSLQPDAISSAVDSLSTDTDLVSMEGSEDTVLNPVEYGASLLHWTSVHVLGKLYRRELLLHEDIFELPRSITVAEDLITNLKIVKYIKGKVAVSSLHKYNYRIIQGSMAHSFKITPEYDWKVLQIVTPVVDATPLDLKEPFVHFRISILRHFICGRYDFDREWAGQLKSDSEECALDGMEKMVIKAIDKPLLRPVIRLLVLERKVVRKLKRI